MLLSVMSQSNNKTLKFGLVISVIVLGLGYAAWTGVQESKTYYVTIKELRSDASAQSKHLRVAGNVVPGTIHQSGTHADFVLVEKDPKTGDSQELRVSYKGSEPPPDTFKDNSQALVIGQYGRDGVFQAHEIQAKCASKYATQPGAATGAAMPADTKRN